MQAARPVAFALSVGIVILPLATGLATAADSVPELPTLTAAQVVEKHVAARGGERAWKDVQSMQLSGTIDAGRGDLEARATAMVNAGRKAGGKGTNAEVAAASATTTPGKEIELPFTLTLKRPNLMRMEIVFDGKTAVQVYDGQHGWKLRPFLNRSDAEPFTADELQAERQRGDLEGPLVNYAAKGTKVELEGTELVDGQAAYRLKVTTKAGAARHIWIDGKSFLDTKIEGVPKRMDGKMHPVYVYQSDFRPVQGVSIPFLMETVVDGYPDRHKLQVGKATINLALGAAPFAKPHT